MRTIRVSTQDQTFVSTNDAYEADDATDRTTHGGFESRDVGKTARQIDDGSRWRVTAVASGVATWAEILQGAATPATLGTTNAAGSAITAAKGDHVHAHGVQTDDSLHAAATITTGGFMSAAQALRLLGVSVESVLVPSGASETDVQTTIVLLTVKNTARSGRFTLTMNKSLDQVAVRAGEVEFAAAWLDDGTQTIEQTNADNADSGATPAITVTLPNAVDVVLTLNADHTVTLAVHEDGTYARSVDSNYTLERITGQIAVVPTFETAISAEDGTTIAMTYDINLDAASEPAVESFTLAGTSSVVASLAISSAVVTLTLDTPILYGETVTLSYAVPETTPLIADGDGAVAAALTTESVTNSTPPVYASGISDSDGNEITMTWGGALNESSTPDTGDFTLNGDDATISGVTVSGSTVVLALTGNIEHGDTITIDYANGTNPIQSAAGVDVLDLTAAPITNAVAPAYSSSTSNNAGDEIALTWAGNLDEGDVPAPGDFTLAGTSATVASVAIAAAVVTLTLTTALVEYGESATVSYTAGATPILSAEGFQVDDLTTEAVTNVTPPDFVSATINAAGSSVVITMEGTMDGGSVPAAGAFTLSGTSATVASVGVSGTDVTLTLSGVVEYGETALVTYVIPGSNKLRENTTEYNAVAFADESIANIRPPALTSLETSIGGGEITLTYEAALDESSTPATGDYTLNGDDATVESVTVDGVTVILTLSGLIENGDTITMDYTGGTNKVRENVTEYNVIDLSGEACVNNVPA